jgi:hypothetical protein
MVSLDLGLGALDLDAVPQSAVGMVNVPKLAAFRRFGINRRPGQREAPEALVVRALWALDHVPGPPPRPPPDCDALWRGPGQ